MDPTSRLQINFPDIWPNKAIIAMKGLPSTCKSDIAAEIGRWARCQVCYIDDFLEAFSFERGYTADFPPSGEEGERLHRLAFNALCRATLRYLHLSNCVVIKSRLCSTFEIDLLMRMVNDIRCYRNARIILIIIECQIKNEYQWHARLRRPNRYGRESVWYKASDRKDIEKATDDDDDYLDSQAWELHLLSFLEANPISFRRRRVTRLVLDPFFDLNLSPSTLFQLTLDFLDAIKYLLIDQHQYLKDLDQDHCRLALYKGCYNTLQYDDLRQDLLVMELGTSRERSKYLCTRKTTKAGSCVFKFWEELACDAEDSCCCAVCGVEVRSGQPGYTCHFCSLTLHKSCAEKIHIDFQNHEHDSLISSLSYNIRRYRRGFSELGETQHGCKACKEGGKNFSSRCESCLFERHLKRGRLPTIINHDCHPLHFFSIQFPSNENCCKACGMSIYKWVGSYGCHICNFIYHMECIFLPGEVKQEHGGYEHVMKLLYSHDSTEPEAEDDHWCNVCYKDMDPQAWFYSCQDCPYYITHACRDCAGEENIEKGRESRNLPTDRSRTNRGNRG